MRINVKGGMQTFAAICSEVCFVDGGLLYPQLLLSQHLLARAARELRRCSDFHQIGHSNRQIRTESKLHFRCTQPEIEGCGTNRQFKALARLAAHECSDR